MSSVHNRLKAIEGRLVRMGAEPVLLDDEIDGIDDAQAAMALRAETDRLALLRQLETEQSLTVSRRGVAERQERLF